MAFEVPPLPYAYDALEPHIDEATMRVHHDKHHQAYVDKANAALEGTEFEGKDSRGRPQEPRLPPVGQAEAGPQQRRRPLQPLAVLGVDEPGRRRRAHRRPGRRHQQRLRLLRRLQGEVQGDRRQPVRVRLVLARPRRLRPRRGRHAEPGQPDLRGQDAARSASTSGSTRTTSSTRTSARTTSTRSGTSSTGARSAPRTTRSPEFASPHPGSVTNLCRVRVNCGIEGEGSGGTVGSSGAWSLETVHFVQSSPRSPAEAARNAPYRCATAAPTVWRPGCCRNAPRRGPCGHAARHRHHRAAPRCGGWPALDRAPCPSGLARPAAPGRLPGRADHDGPRRRDGRGARDRRRRGAESPERGGDMGLRETRPRRARDDDEPRTAIPPRHPGPPIRLPRCRSSQRPARHEARADAQRPEAGDERERARAGRGAGGDPGPRRAGRHGRRVHALRGRAAPEGPVPEGATARPADERASSRATRSTRTGPRTISSSRWTATATTAREQAFERDRRKDAALQTAGYRVVRITWRRLTTEPLAVSAQLGALLRLA